MDRRNTPQPIDPGHEAKRAMVSRVGLGLLAVGVPCAVVGVALFVSTFFSDPTDMSFGRPIAGMILAFVGAVMSMIGLQAVLVANAGKILRYQAGEVLPVAHDATIETLPLVTEATRAVREGLFDPEQTVLGPRVRHSCGTTNGPDDRFCKGCGAALAPRLCPACQARSDADAKFCANCGAGLMV